MARSVIILWIALFYFINEATSQQYRQIKTPQAVSHFINLYNNMDTSNIFDLFSERFLETISLNKLSGFLSGVHQSFSPVETIYFREKDERNLDTYVMQSGKKLMLLKTVIDSTGKLDRLIITDANYNEVLPYNVSATKMQLPFNEEWMVFWGGDLEEQNYHVTNRAQKNAFDFVIVDSAGKSYAGDRKKNENYYAFGKNIYAPCDGIVTEVIDGIADNIPGNLNHQDLTGNTVVIKTINGEFLLLAHFQQNSINVSMGQVIKAGASLGRCGNSGRSSEPHLHMHLMDLEEINEGTGIKFLFDKLVVNGQIKTGYSPVKKDKISKL